MSKSSLSGGLGRRAFALVLSLSALFFFQAGCAKQKTPPAEREAEARRLYDRANLFVSKIGEGEYSYEYINFHYKQAMDNVDRVLFAYPETDTAKKLKAGELNLGKFTVEYFRDTLLAQLGDMKEATESVVNCAIYLHTLPEANRAEARGALTQILETLCRLVRSDEALIFPTLPEDRTLAKETIVRTITRYLQKDISLSLVQGAEADEQPVLAAAYGEGMAIGGLKLEGLDEWIEKYPTADKRVELGVFRGMVERESIAYRDTFDKVKKKREEDARKAALESGKKIEPAKPSVRYDISAFYQEKFGPAPAPAAVAIYARYLALQGKLDEARALVAKVDERAQLVVIENYYEHLSLTEKLTGKEDLHRRFSSASAAAAEMKLVELLTENAKYADAQAVEAAGVKAYPELRDQFVRARMKGVFYSRQELFYLTDKTIPALEIKDPAVCAEILLDWFLSPNRLQKGSSWGADQILFKYFSMQRQDRPISRKLIKTAQN